MLGAEDYKSDNLSAFGISLAELRSEVSENWSLDQVFIASMLAHMSRVQLQSTQRNILLTWRVIWACSGSNWKLRRGFLHFAIAVRVDVSRFVTRTTANDETGHCWRRTVHTVIDFQSEAVSRASFLLYHADTSCPSLTRKCSISWLLYDSWSITVRRPS